MKYRPIVALLDDDPGFRKDIRNLLSADCEVRDYGTESELMEALSFSQPDLLLLDLDLGHEDDGFKVLEHLRNNDYHFPVMLLTIHAGSRTTAKAVEYDIPFLHKDRDIEDVKAFRSALLRAIEHHLLKTEVQYYRSRTQPSGTKSFPWPNSGECEGLQLRLDTLAQDNEIVLVAGERGTGKLTACKWMHNTRNGSGPLVTLSARDRDPQELEAELYGTEKGAPEPGALAAASGGSLLLVGLEELPADVLRRLNLVASSGSYRPKGAARPRRMAAKILATCQLGAEPLDWSQDLTDAWQSRMVTLPPLRKRKADLAFHAQVIASKQDATGPLGRISSSDLPKLSELKLAGNFHDLAVAVNHGVDGLINAQELLNITKKSYSKIDLRDFHRLGWHGAMGALETALSLSVYEACEWKDACWKDITLLPRATRFKKKKLARDALDSE